MSWRRFFRRGGWDRERAEELEAYLAIESDDNRSRGMSAEEARHAALRKLGNPTTIRESIYRTNSLAIWDALAQNVRYGLRSLRRAPGFTIAAVLTMALGIAATTVMFSVVQAVILRPLPYRDPGRLAMVWTDNRLQGLHESGVTYPDFAEWKKESAVFDDLALCSRSTAANLSGMGDPEHVPVATVTLNLFRLLGAAPAIGRVFGPEDAGAGERLVLISHRLWLRRFGGATSAIGAAFEVDGKPARIIGVMPAAFQFPGRDTEFWQPIDDDTLRATQNQRWKRNWRVVARLRSGISWEAAQSRMDGVAAAEAAAYPETNAHYGIRIVPLAQQVVGSQARAALWILFAAVVAVLAIACSNVANLMLARGSRRARELALRTALGAGRGRIAGQLLVEALLVSLGAAAAGVGAAEWGLALLARFGPANLARIEDVTIDLPLLAFAIGLSLVAALLCGLAPALRLSRVAPQEALRTGRGQAGDRAARRLRQALIAAEFALAMVLLAGAGLLFRSFLRVMAVDPGFRPQHVLTMKIARPHTPPGSPDAATTAFYREVFARVSALPAVAAVGAVNSFSIDGNPDDQIEVPGRPADPRGAPAQLWDDAVSAGYLPAIGARLIAGRQFDDRDGAHSLPVAIVSETMARRFWPGESAVGKQFRFANDGNAPYMTVIGVVGDMRRQGLEKTAVAQVYRPYPQFRMNGGELVVRTAGDPLRLAAAVRAAIRATDPHIPVYGIGTIEQFLDSSVAERRLETLLLGIFSGLALALAGVGIYGLIHYMVAQRTQEIGIRMALGAGQLDVLMMVVREGGAIAAVGTAAGLAAALAITRSMRGLLYGVEAADPLTFAAAPAVLLAVALIAAIVPARRAAAVDPLAALRME
jgi:predicted permease